jgi:hypothetical protein
MPTATSVLAIPIAWDLPHDLARRFTTILPAMTLAEALAAARLQRIAARPGARTALVTTHPCRAPTTPSRTPGGSAGRHLPRPGEGSIRAHPTCSGWSLLSPHANSPDVLGSTSGTCLLTPRSSFRRVALHCFSPVIHPMRSCCWHPQESASMPWARIDPSSTPPVGRCLVVPRRFLARPRRLTRVYTPSVPRGSFPSEPFPVDPAGLSLIAVR